MISYLQIDKLTKSFGDLVLFEDITFGIAQGQKVGLIAKNGTGKTTLLNIIAGKEDYDSGAVVFRNDLRVGYLESDAALSGRPDCFASVFLLSERDGASDRRI